MRKKKERKWRCLALNLEGMTSHHFMLGIAVGAQGISRHKIYEGKSLEECVFRALIAGESIDKRKIEII